MDNPKFIVEATPDLLSEMEELIIYGGSEDSSNGFNLICSNTHCGGNCSSECSCKSEGPVS